MRALPPPLVAAVLAVATAAVAAPPALLVLRAACDIGDPAAFAETSVERYTSSQGSLHNPIHVMSYEDTCGPEWRAAVTRSSLATLSSGGGMGCAGWPGADVCEALAAASRALRRPQPGVCGAGAARAAAVARLATRLRWKRALLPPAPPRSECAAALREVARTLAAAGPVVRHAPISPEELARKPHVVILCTSRQSKVAWETGALVSVARAGAVLLLVYVEELDSAPRARSSVSSVEPEVYAFPSDDIDLVVQKTLLHSQDVGNSSSAPPVSVTSVPGNADVLSKYRGVRRKRGLVSVDFYRHKIESGTEVDALRSASSKVLSEDSVLREAERTNVKKIFRHSEVRRGRMSRDGDIVRFVRIGSDLSRYDGESPWRLLLLGDDRFDRDPASRSIRDIYEEALHAVEHYADAERTRSEVGHFVFHLYERSENAFAGASWSRIAVLATTLMRSLDESREWVTLVELMNVTRKLDRWSEPQMTGDRDEGGLGAAPTALAACAAVALAAGGALAARWAATRRRRRRRRGDAVLAPTDFTFPVDETRRVGEGMETMLSCWLQRLHEFGGPELERPDLLKQPPCAAPRASSVPSSTCSVNRVAQDRRTRYKGDAVHIKYLPTSGTIELKRKATDVLLVMQSLRHENLNPFIGCLCEVRPAFVFDHCWRGSLEDVLMADDIKLDWTFRLSLLTDLVKGMRYLHGSPLRVHGRLSSRNCVVDSRWVLRLTDYGLLAFHRAQALPLPQCTARELLWTAPELLRETRNGCGASGGGGDGGGFWRGSQAGDVFSFAIVMQEVIVRGEPYCMLALTPEEIVEKVSRPPPLIRPSVSMGAAPPEAVSVMRQCWSEAPDLRPDFHRLHDIFRHLHRGRKVNIVDSMFEMLEKYSNNLEELIKERTEELDMEKKKTEQLLNRMLPRTVAERLMLGSRVEPEEFEEVSIYFSDIVGFTALAARSTPVQVVDLLNDLYTTFDAAIERYRVYKVETIGDAYMVVGGLPTRTHDHAESVATMALHLLHLAGRFRVRHLPDTPLHLRIGLHSGPCCAGVVGLTMPRYCLFGDTVNTASRMESTGAAWRIQVSAATADRLVAAGGYRLRSRGLTQIKGKGAMYTYWLLGKDGFDKPLPTPPPLETEEMLLETDYENESEASSGPPSTSAAARCPDERPADLSFAADDPARQRSGALSADSSPPRESRDRMVPPPASGDRGASYSRYRWLPGGSRALRRQWSLERGESLAAAAASDPAPVQGEPLALVAGTPPRPAGPAGPARYRTRPDPSDDDVRRPRPP